MYACLLHYRYERNKEGPYLIQVGIGADKHDFFCASAAEAVAAAEARICPLQQCGFPHTDLPVPRAAAQTQCAAWPAVQSSGFLCSCCTLISPSHKRVYARGCRIMKSRRLRASCAALLPIGAALSRPRPRPPARPRPRPRPRPHSRTLLRRVTALLRLLVGRRARGLCRWLLRGWRSAETQTAAQLFADSYQAALWTSAHAAYIDMLKQHGAGGAPPAPTLPQFRVPLRITTYPNFYKTRKLPKACVQEAQPMLMLLQSSMSPGHRGWDTGLVTALKHRGTALVLRHSVLCCLLGMHPQLEPRNRPHWRIRMKALRVLGRGAQAGARGGNLCRVLYSCKRGFTA